MRGEFPVMVAENNHRSATVFQLASALPFTIVGFFAEAVKMFSSPEAHTGHTRGRERRRRAVIPMAMVARPLGSGMAKALRKPVKPSASPET